MQTANPATSTNLIGEPTWEIARLFPNQGAWSEQEYLELKGNRLIEFSCGNVELPCCGWLEISTRWTVNIGPAMRQNQSSCQASRSTLRPCSANANDADHRKASLSR